MHVSRQAPKLSPDSITSWAIPTIKAYIFITIYVTFLRVK